MTTDKKKTTKDPWRELTETEVDQIWAEATHKIPILIEPHLRLYHTFNGFYNN